MFLVFETCRKISSAIKIFLTLLENIFASWGANFVSVTMFSEMGKQGNRKHVSKTIFPDLPKGLTLFNSHISGLETDFVSLAVKRSRVL